MVPQSTHLIKWQHQHLNPTLTHVSLGDCCLTRLASSDGNIHANT